MPDERTRQARWNAANSDAIRAAQVALRRRNERIVEQELQRRGGACVYPGCDSTKIEWHHRDPLTSRSKINRSIRVHSESRLREELAKCDPLCRRHHMTVDGRLAAALLLLERARAIRWGHVKA